jgi:hypothetical protein
MIKALLLIFRPVQTWGGIDAANRSIAYVLCLHLLPLILLTSLAEGYGLMTWGRAHKGEMTYIKKYELAEVVIIQAAQVVVYLGLVFLAAFAAKNYAGTFHRRSTYRQAFTAIAYGLAPMFLLRLGDLISGLNAWVPWAVGIVLAIGVLYLGLPCLLRPDPPHAFGLYVMTSLTLLVAFGLYRLVYWQFFLGKFPALEKAVSSLAGVSATGGTPP